MWSLLQRLYTSKLFPSIQSAIFDISNNSSIAIGGYGSCGVPDSSIIALSKRNLKDLTIVSYSCGIENQGVQKLLSRRQVKRLITNTTSDNENFFFRYQSGDIEVELVSCGILAEKLRAGGAGIPAFYTTVGYGLFISDGSFPVKMDPSTGMGKIFLERKEVKEIDGKFCVLEKSIRTDFAFVKAWKGDRLGNLVFRGTARNFNPVVAMAGKITIAEVEELVEPGEIDPNEIHTPGVYVHRVVVEKYKNEIERLTLDTGIKLAPGKKSQREAKDNILRRAVKELKPGMNVSLGSGLPALLPSYIPASLQVQFLSESGCLGVGAYPKPGLEDPDLINSAKETCTYTAGASFLNTVEVFSMIRGGHLDINMVGAMQISADGDLANFYAPGKLLKGIGSFMDVTVSGSRCIVLMEHTSKNLSKKILKKCLIPIVGRKMVNLLITEYGVFDFDRPEGITLVEIGENFTLDQVLESVDCKLNVASDLKKMNLGESFNY